MPGAVYIHFADRFAIIPERHNDVTYLQSAVSNALSGLLQKGQTAQGVEYIDRHAVRHKIWFARAGSVAQWNSAVREIGYGYFQVLVGYVGMHVARVLAQTDVNTLADPMSWWGAAVQIVVGVIWLILGAVYSQPVVFPVIGVISAGVANFIRIVSASCCSKSPQGVPRILSGMMAFLCLTTPLVLLFAADAATLRQTLPPLAWLASPLVSFVWSFEYEISLWINGVCCDWRNIE